MPGDPALEERSVVPYRPDAALVAAHRYRVSGPAAAVWIVVAGLLWLRWSGPVLPAVAVAAAAALLVAAEVTRPDPARVGDVPARPAWTGTADGVPPLRPGDLAPYRGRLVRQVTAALLLLAACLWAAAAGSPERWSPVDVAGAFATFRAVQGAIRLVGLLRLPGRDLRPVDLAVGRDAASPERRLLLSTETLTWSAERRGLLADAAPGDVVVGHLRPGSAEIVAVTADGRRSLVEAHVRADGGRRGGTAS